MLRFGFGAWFQALFGEILVKKKRKKPKEGEIKHLEHFLVPHHEIVKDDEVNKLLETLSIVKEQLPRISPYDPAIADLFAKEGDIIRIKRADEATYYRIVVRE